MLARGLLESGKYIYGDGLTLFGNYIAVETGEIFPVEKVEYGIDLNGIELFEGDEVAQLLQVEKEEPKILCKGKIVLDRGSFFLDTGRAFTSLYVDYLGVKKL